MFNANCINCFRGQGLAVCNWSGQRAQERFVCWGKVCSTSIWRKSKSFSLEDWIDTLGKTQHPQQRPSHGKWYLFLLMGKNQEKTAVLKVGVLQAKVLGETSMQKRSAQPILYMMFLYGFCCFLSPPLTLFTLCCSLCLCERKKSSSSSVQDKAMHLESLRLQIKSDNSTAHWRELDPLLRRVCVMRVKRLKANFTWDHFFCRILLIVQIFCCWLLFWPVHFCCIFAQQHQASASGRSFDCCNFYFSHA